MKILRGGSENFYTPEGQGGSEKIVSGLEERGSEIFTTKGGEGLQKIEPLARGPAKISSFEFQNLPPPLVILNELSLIDENRYSQS